MITQEEINRLNRIFDTTDNDWAKEVQFIEMGVERMLKPPRHPSPHFKEKDTKQDFYAEIERENVEASQARINYHE
ncbi:MAG TPA: hypothetical protein VK578_10340 [Edaphobacter sp.]|nr:hypothetical protein [Edaphobacter sp.]